MVPRGVRETPRLEDGFGLADRGLVVGVAGEPVDVHVLAGLVPDAERELVEGLPPVDPARGVGERGAERAQGLMVGPPRDRALEEVREPLVSCQPRVQLAVGGAPVALGRVELAGEEGEWPARCWGSDQ